MCTREIRSGVIPAVNSSRYSFPAATFPARVCVILICAIAVDDARMVIFSKSNTVILTK